MTQQLEQLLFPSEWTKAALILALISVWVVIALFAYLNRMLKRPYFSLWTVAWMFYAIYLAACIGLEDAPRAPLLVMARLCCLGLSALFMFWGSFQLAKRDRPQRELFLAVGMMVVWSYIAAFTVGASPWITAPVFFLLAGAGVYTGISYARQRQYSSGARILGTGFVLWGLHLLGVPFLGFSPALLTLGYFVSALLALMIIVGMVMEQQFNASEQDYRSLFDSAGDALLLLDPATLNIREANTSAQRLIDQPGADLAGRCFLEFYVDQWQVLTGAGNKLHTCKVALKRGGELCLMRPDGRQLTCELSANLAHSPRGEVLQIDLRDITVRKRAEQGLLQQERFRALEQMARGVAHDFNNVLAKILGFNELLLTWPENLADVQRTKKILQMINNTAQEATEIVRRLREFYRPRKQSETKTPINILPIIERAIALTKPSWDQQARARGVTVQLLTTLEPVPPVEGSDSELREVLINLILNSVDALPEGGTIRITTRASSDHVVIEVQDTGIGMTEDVRQRCLEPFFSTKGNASMGLGLSIVFGIIRRHGGEVVVASKPGQGTTFTLRLPAYAGNEAVPAQPLRRLHALVVEDEPDLRQILSEYLSGDGHTCETATNGREALERFRAGRFDLVIADHVMPELNGDGLATAVKALSPQSPVILVTGYGDGLPENVDLVLQKPVTQAALRQGLAQVLTRKES